MRQLGEELEQYPHRKHRLTKMAETGRTRDSIAKYRTDQRQKELEAELRARSRKSQRQKNKVHKYTDTEKARER